MNISIITSKNNRAIAAAALCFRSEALTSGGQARRVTRSEDKKRGGGLSLETASWCSEIIIKRITESVIRRKIKWFLIKLKR